MFNDSFPVKFITSPSATFAGIAGGKTGWAWPLAIFAASIISSALLLSSVPAEFLARASTDLPYTGGLGLTACVAAGLPGGLLFNAFFCALISAFTPFLRSGRLMLRLPVPLAGVGAYALFFIFRLNAAGGGAAGWLAAAAVLAFGTWAALRDRPVYAALLKVLLAICIFALASDLACAAAVLADAPRAYKASEYLFAFISIGWLIKGTSAVCGLPDAKAFAAVLPALLGAAAFAFSLLTLGLLSPEIFQMLILI